ncbi:hypothetical protein HanIR_Chr06g0288101 [Helianthus annuus]|nr:hypothetical protein HanIR_Chr06g0288101 [Helianthus annuus]
MVFSSSYDFKDSGKIIYHLEKPLPKKYQRMQHIRTCIKYQIYSTKKRIPIQNT